MFLPAALAALLQTRSGDELVRATVLCRHGERSPVAFNGAGAPHEQTWRDRGLADPATVPGPTMPVVGVPAGDRQARGAFGRLTTTGVEQLRRRGEEFRRLYTGASGLLHDPITTDQIKVFATVSEGTHDPDVERTVLSDKAFVAGLAGNTTRLQGLQCDAHLRQSLFSALSLKHSSPQVEQQLIDLEQAFISSPAGVALRDEYASQQQQFSAAVDDLQAGEAPPGHDDYLPGVAGLRPWHMIHDWLRAYTDLGQPQFKVPAGGADAAERFLMAAFQGLFTEQYTGLFGKPLLDLVLQDLSDEHSHMEPLHLYGVHDMTLVALFSAAGVPADKWEFPLYGSCLAVELWDRDGSRRVDYFLSNGASGFPDDRRRLLSTPVPAAPLSREEPEPVTVTVKVTVA